MTTLKSLLPRLPGISAQSIAPAFVILGLFPTFCAGQVTVTTFDHNGDGLGGDNVGADTYISEQDPDTNFGSLDRISVRHPDGTNPNQTAPRTRVSYARFDLSAINDTSATTQAAIQLYDYRFDDSANDLAGLQIQVYGLIDESQDGWNESAITWNGSTAGFPANEAAPAHQADGNVNDGLDLVSGEAMFLFDFTFDNSVGPAGWSGVFDHPNLLSLVQDDTNDSLTLMFSLAPGTNLSRLIGSKESELEALNSNSSVPLGSLAPRLILDGVEFGSAANLIPEPSAIAVWLILGFSASLFTRFGMQNQRI